MGKEEKLIRQTVMLPADWVREIQRLYIDRRGSAHGAMQDALLRGAELVIEELRHGTAGPAQPPHGEFVKCPKHLIAVIQGIINQLSNPAEYEAILQEGIRAKMKEQAHGIKKVK